MLLLLLLLLHHSKLGNSYSTTSG